MTRITTADLLKAVRHNPAALRALREQTKVDPMTVGDVGCERSMASHATELRTGPNARLHRMERSRLVKLERETATSLLKSLRQIPRLPIVVTLTRVGRKAMDDDNLRGAFKAMRDGIADVYGVSDADERIRFVYAQKIEDFEPAVWIDIDHVKEVSK